MHIPDLMYISFKEKDRKGFIAKLSQAPAPAQLAGFS